MLSSSDQVLYILHRVEDVTEPVRPNELGEELRGRTRKMELEVVQRSRELATADAELSSANARRCSGPRLPYRVPSLPEPMYVDREMWEKIALNLLSHAF